MRIVALPKKPRAGRTIETQSGFQVGAGPTSGPPREAACRIPRPPVQRASLRPPNWRGSASGVPQVAYGAEEFRFQLVVGGSVVEGGTDHEFSADAHDAELLVPHRGGRVPAGSRHARLDEVPYDGEQPLQRFRLDRQVAPRGEGDEGLARSVEKVDCDRPRALLRALASSHGILSTVPIRSTGKGGSWSSEALPAVAARRENRATEV